MQILQYICYYVYLCTCCISSAHNVIKGAHRVGKASEGACNIPYTGKLHSLVPRFISQALWLGLSFILQAKKALKISPGTRLYNSNMADFLLCLVSTVTIFSSTILLWLKKPAMIEFRHLRSYVLPRRLCCSMSS